MAPRLMLSLAEARALLLQDIVPCPTETLAIRLCAGRILAADVIATRDQPPAALSAMDGYAARSEDAIVGASLRVVGEAPAGRPYAGTVGPGETVRIATGGVVPDGADHIVIQEIVARAGDIVTLAEASPPNAFIRHAGCDFRAQTAVAHAGQLLTPARLALAAAANAPSLEVRRRPTVAIIASGDELREPGAHLACGDIVNSAGHAIAALAEEWGATANRCPILPDDPALCMAMLRELDLAVDVIVTLGGASVGDRDALRPAFAELGARIVFERIAVQPGKPTWHARFPDGRLLLGLPGNPASAFVCAQLLLKPLLYALTGRDPAEAQRTIPAVLAEALPATSTRETYLRAAATVDREGRLRVAAMMRQDSSLLTPLASANALVGRSAHSAAAAAGDPVEFLPIGPIAAHSNRQGNLP